MAIFATVCIERFGGKLGGLLGSLPTTIVPASLGFHAHAANDIELLHLLLSSQLMLINAIFLYVWRVLPPKLSSHLSLYTRLFVMSLASLLIWAICAFTFVQCMGFIDIEHVIWVGIIGQSILSGFGIWACKDGVPASQRQATCQATRFTVPRAIGGIGSRAIDF